MDAELLTLAVMQALLGYTSEARWLRDARMNLVTMARTCPSNRATQAAAQARRDDALADGGAGPAGTGRRR